MATGTENSEKTAKSDADAFGVAKPTKPIDIEKLITYANLHGWF